LLGLPVPEIRFYGPSASYAIVVEGDTKVVEFSDIEKALAEPGVQLRIFGKPEVKGHRRMGVLLATAETTEEALAKCRRAAEAMTVKAL
ncbi:MAG: phosphoribosylglycinamide formyltransferase 2, partial [Paramuribaculum sp.]|nr:phosphoribosylglycinamide formyltransferase 2 [Paramuribaculum sp.]